VLNRFELLISFLGAWIVSGIIYAILKRRMRDKLPKGSIVINATIPFKSEKKPGSQISKLGVTIGMGTSSLTFVVVIILCAFDLWDFVSKFIAINLPYWVNWIGIIGIWINYIYGLSIMVYNVNYTPLFKPMKAKYVLATGGPYSLMRHPMYMIYFYRLFLIFLATGIWFMFFGLIGFVALPYQAKKEEEALQELFGKVYEDYASKTGRFFPKIQKK
jgi:protein-S-isoprenylcysteine O-methyltransferase Ste14